MTDAVQPSIHVARNRHGAPEVLVVGAGIIGLWAARHAIRAGKTVTVLEKRRVGGGASGGVMGALMPHMPDRWNAKKQFQFEALAGLEAAIGELEDDTGLACGYRRCGRLMPIRSESTLAEIEARIEGARANWGGRFSLERIEPAAMGRYAAWLDVRQAPCGVQWDDLSARIDPRACLASLASFIRARGELREGAHVVGIEPGCVRLADGSRLPAGEIVVAAGWEAYDLLQPAMGVLTGGRPIGRGVKGQAILLDLVHDDSGPIIYADGVHVVPHAANRVAIGSSTVEDWQSGAFASPEAFDPDDVGFQVRAVDLVPALGGAAIIDRWAGVRPRNMLAPRSTDPWFGPVPGVSGVTARIGGFKIGLGIGHVESSWDADVS